MGVLEAKLFITAKDETGAAFKAIEERIERMAKMTNEVGRLGGSAAGMSGAAMLAGEFEKAERAAVQMTSAMRSAGEAAGFIERNLDGVANHAQRAERHISALSRVMHGTRHFVREVSPLVMGGAGFGMLEETKKFTEGGAEIQGERARMKVGGIPDEEIARADSQSAELAAKFPNVPRAGILENYKELRSILQHPEETSDMIETVIKARSAMDALDPSGKSSEGLKTALKGAELLGKARDKEALSKYLDGFIRAQQVMGSTVDPEQLGDFAKYTRSAGQLLSDRFLHTTANSLIQEEKGSTAGKMVADVVKEMTGGFEGYQSAAKQLIALGLAKDADFNHNKQGEVHGLKPGHHIQDWQLWQSEPDKAVWDKLVPAMVAKGHTEPQDQVALARRLFPNSLAADFISKLILQRAAFENHAKQYGAAAGMEGGLSLVGEDPKAALGALGTAIASFGATLTSPIMKDAAKTMSAMGSMIGSWGKGLADWQKANPTAAKVLAGGSIAGGLAAGGALGYGALTGLTTGFGLSGSAAALDASAAALDGAAAKLAGGSAAGGLGTAAKAGGLGLLGALGWLGLGVGSAILGATAEPTPNPETQKKMDDWYKEHPHPWKDTFQPVGDFFQKHSPDFGKIFGAVADWLVPSAHADTLPAGFRHPAGQMTPPTSLVPPSSTAKPFDPSMLSGKIEATVVPGQISAKVEGQVQGSIAVKVDASPELKATIAAAKGGSDKQFNLKVGSGAPDTGTAGRKP